MAQTIRPDMEEMWSSSHLDAGSASWVEALYEVYLKNPEAIDTKWRQFFDGIPAAKKSNGNGANGSSDAHLEALHSEVREYFKHITSVKNNNRISGSANVSREHESKQVYVLQLINAYRFRGHQTAIVNPLNGKAAINIQELDLEYYGLKETDLETVFDTGSLAASDSLNLKEIHDILRETYCGSVGAEYMHITETDEKRWLQQR